MIILEKKYELKEISKVTTYALNINNIYYFWNK